LKATLRDPENVQQHIRRCVPLLFCFLWDKACRTICYLALLVQS
jgi:hypothetical protein